MIGQTKILDWIDNNIKSFPKFIILVAPKGCGKTMIAKYIASKLSATLVACGVKVDDVREIIDLAYTVKDTTVYYFRDADTMRNEAKNAMLKVTEEPPKNAYFVMSVQDDSTLLDTIKSRGNVMYLEPYTKEQLVSYFWSEHEEGDYLELNIITEIANTPYEVDLMQKYGQEFIDYVNLVIDNLGEVQPANAFKSAGKLALKDEEDKYDLKLFWKTFCNVCYIRLINKGRANGKTLLCHYINTTSEYIYKLQRLGVNKQQLYDNWVFAIRGVYYDYN